MFWHWSYRWAIRKVTFQCRTKERKMLPLCSFIPANTTTSKALCLNITSLSRDVMESITPGAWRVLCHSLWRSVCTSETRMTQSIETGGRLSILLKYLEFRRPNLSQFTTENWYNMEWKNSTSAKVPEPGFLVPSWSQSVCVSGDSYVLPMSVWVSCGFSSFHPPPKNILVFHSRGVYASLWVLCIKLHFFLSY